MTEPPKEELRALFEQYKLRADVRLWIKGAGRHAFRVWSDGYKAARQERNAGVALPAAPRFDHTYCSQCGADLGPGEHGVSSCCDHGHCQVEARGDKCECDRTPAEKGLR